MVRFKNEDFKYQLTEFEPEVFCLEYATKQLKKNHRPYVVRMNQWRQYAVYTEGLHMGGWVKDTARGLKNQAVYYFDGDEGRAVVFEG